MKKKVKKFLIFFVKKTVKDGEVFKSKNKEGKEYFEVNNEDGGEENHPEEVKVNMTENSEIQDSKVNESKLGVKSSEIKLVESKLVDSKIANSKLDPKASNIASSNVKVSNVDTHKSKTLHPNSNSKSGKQNENSSKGNKKSNFGKSAASSASNKKNSKAGEKSNIKVNGSEKKDQANNSKANDSKKPAENDKKDGVPNKNIANAVNVKPGEKEKNAKEKVVEEKKDENVEDLENLRTQKLMNSKDNNRKIVVFEFAFIALLFIIYFIVDFILELDYLNNIRQSYYHLQLISNRPSIVKYTVVFTIEQLATATIQMQNSLVFTNGTNIDVRNYYTNFIYDNERNIFETMTQSFPSEFNTYENIFELYNYDDLCQNYYATTTTQAQATSI